MTDKVKEILKVAICELGYSEDPKDSNIQKYGEWYGMNGYAWCAMFISWIFDQAGIPLEMIDTEKGMHYCPSALNYFRKNEMITIKPQSGDLVFFDWQNDGKVDHVGIFLQNRTSVPGNFISIEGNTALGNDSNGGSVMLRVRDYAHAIFVHPSILDN